VVVNTLSPRFVDGCSFGPHHGFLFCLVTPPTSSLGFSPPLFLAPSLSVLFFTCGRTTFFRTRARFLHPFLRSSVGFSDCVSVGPAAGTLNSFQTLPEYVSLPCAAPWHVGRLPHPLRKRTLENLPFSRHVRLPTVTWFFWVSLENFELLCFPICYLVRIAVGVTSFAQPTTQTKKVFIHQRLYFKPLW